MAKPADMFGTATYADAVPTMLDARSWTAAMWAARLSAAREDRVAAEALTDQVLAYPGTQQALSQFRNDPKCWAAAMGAAAFATYRAGQPKAAGPGSSDGGARV